MVGSSGRRKEPRAVYVVVYSPLMIKHQVGLKRFEVKGVWLSCFLICDVGSVFEYPLRCEEVCVLKREDITYSQKSGFTELENGVVASACLKVV